MSRNWTPDQLSAINTHGKTILVSAAAGSGKTAALTERIIRSLINSANDYDNSNKADISRLLVVTFTKAAASELKERISKALYNALAVDPHNTYLQNQLSKLSGASICTIDAFYVNTVKKYFNVLNIPSSFRIADTTELTVLCNDIMDEVIEEFYNNNDNGAFATLADSLTRLKSDATLNAIFQSIYEDLANYPEGIELLKAFISDLQQCCVDNIGNRILSDSKFGKYIIDNVSSILKELIDRTQRMLDEMSHDEVIYKGYSKSFNDDLNYYNRLLELLLTHDYNEIHSLTVSFKRIAIGRVTKAENKVLQEKCKQTRGSLNEQYEKIVPLFRACEDELLLTFKATVSTCEVLYELLSEYNSRLIEEKVQRGMFSFSDISKLMLKLVRNSDGSATEIAHEIAERYDEIYIDEFQDTNSVQDAIFTAISTSHNRFMVGDIKQSIYAFRGSEPHIFQGYRNLFPKLNQSEGQNSDYVSIFMSDNFRCDENIVRFVNTICSYIFTLCKETLNYTEDDDLKFSKAKPYANYISPKTTVAIIETKPDPDDLDEDEEELENLDNLISKDTPLEKECIYIVNEIRRLISSEKLANGQPIKPGDIAILVRTKKQVAMVNNVLARYDISSVSPTEVELFRTPEVLLMTSFISVIDNPTNDIHLTSVLCSPIFKLTLDDILLIRKREDCALSLYENAMNFYEGDASVDCINQPLIEKLGEFFKVIDKYRIFAQSLSIDKLLRLIYRDPLFAFIARSKSLSDFYEYARKFESGSFKGLYNFVRYVETVKDKSVGGGEFAQSPESVTVMNFHKSKGLEFPVCFVAGTSTRLNFDSLHQNYVFDRELGIGLHITDESLFAQYNTLARKTIVLKKHMDMMQEEMRILYVALTRARERLYVTCSTPNAIKLLSVAQENFPEKGEYNATHIQKYSEWIIDALCGYALSKNTELTSLLNDESKCDFMKIISVKVKNLYKVQSTGIAEEGKKTVSPSKEGNIIPVDKKVKEQLVDRFNFEYPYSHMTSIPAKLSVSRLSPDVLDGFDDFEAPTHFGERTNMDFLFDIDKCLGESTPSSADKGIATHLVFQFCDFNNLLVNGVDNELSRLVDKGFIPASTLDLIRNDEILRFTTSELFERICNAERIYREQRFNLFFDAAEFISDPNLMQKMKMNEEKILVQGVIDIFFYDQNGRLILCDYKTDRIDREIANDDNKVRQLMKDRHGEQLKYYRRAIQLLCGRYPDETMIYLTQLGRHYVID